eukprot:EG_transcript_3457
MGYTKRKKGQARRPNDDWSRHVDKADEANPLLEAYYASIVPPGEWDAFYAALHRPLPTTFWINPGAGRLAVRDFLQRFCHEVQDLEIDGILADPPRPLPFYPEQMAWQVNIPRVVLRKHEQLRELHQFLMQETAVGSITRQELVSMVPCLVLDVRPGHAVLDMCAAPGSKTAQLLCQLAGQHGAAADFHPDAVLGPKSGFLVANELDQDRAELLIFQIKRFSQFYPLAIFTNHNAMSFPTFSLPSPGGPAELRFDRILCDVMCSGDGTIRKHPSIWRDWSPRGAFQLMHQQLRVAIRAAKLLTVGGRMVYSTCSLNPVEDEAVIVQLLRRCQGSVRLVPLAEFVPALVFSPGLHTWRVMDHAGVFYDEMPTGDALNRHAQRLHPDFFPPPLAEAQALRLELCARILPHQQDSGGFFLALLEKVQEVPDVEREPLPIAPEEEPTATPVSPKADGDEAVAPPPAAAVESCDPAEAPDSAAARRQQKKEESRRQHGRSVTGRYVYRPLEAAAVAHLKEFYGLAEDFPFHQLYTRTLAEELVGATEEGEGTGVLLVSAAVKRLLDLPAEAMRYKVINTGLLTFERDRLLLKTGAGFALRPKSEAADLLVPYMAGSPRLVPIPLEELLGLLQAPDKTVPVAALAEATRRCVGPLGMGGFIWVVREARPPLHFVALRARTTVNTLVADSALEFLLPRLRRLQPSAAAAVAQPAGLPAPTA